MEKNNRQTADDFNITNGKAPEKTGGYKIIAKRVKKEIHALKRVYRRSLREASGAGEWLRDNYYLLEREARGAIGDLQKTKHRASCTPARKQDLDFRKSYAPRIYRYCAEAARMDDALADALTATLEKSKARLTTVDISLTGAMLRAALIHMAYEAVFRTDSVGSVSELDERVKSSVKIGKAVGKLRSLPSIDVQELVEQFCPVENLFSKDPANVYNQMDEQTKGYYRAVCAKISKKQGISEMDLAGRCLNSAEGEKGRKSHVGYWLFKEKTKTEKNDRRGRIFLALKWITPLVAAGIISYFLRLYWLPIVIYLPILEFLRPIFDSLSTKGVAPAMIPKMELENGIPKDEPTLVVVSQLVPSPEKAGAFAKQLLQLSRVSGKGAVKICLLCDLKQANKPSRPEDETAVKALRREISNLNRDHDNRFILIVRKRSRIITQHAYAGWERKRGAITELVRMIKGENPGFLAFEGDRQFLRRTKYMIALDADTEMLMETAEKLVSAAMHPLNKPLIDEENGIVTEGFGILAPRVETSLDSASDTAFSRIMSGAGGVTSYDTLSGDFYQDLFGRSIFAGKGLINVDAFYACMDDFLPEEKVLSHDILEGSVLRCGYISDAEVTDGCPSGAMPFLSRLHRWIRGDWQNMPYIFRKVTDARKGTQNPNLDDGQLLEDEVKPGGDKRKRRNPLPGLCRYMLFDNLRRSFTPITYLICLFLSFAVVGSSPLAVPVLALAAILPAAAPGLFSFFYMLIGGGIQMLSRRYYSRVMPAAFTALAQALFSCLLMFQNAWISLDAISRALWRQAFGHRNLLEWVTAADSEKKSESFLRVVISCWPGIICGAILLFAPGSIVRLAALFGLLSPFAVYFSRVRTPAGQRKFSLAEKERLRSYAAAMWKFYEELCGKTDNYLPPDNIQEAPVYAVAHRTSPTNIGLALLCTLAARDLGLIDSGTLFRRLRNTVSSVERLEKWHGNLLNWYDTKTLQPLFPKYVSTVDSGNFACCLLALRQGILEYTEEDKDVADLIQRIDKLINDTDLTSLYDKRRKLFYIGFDPESGELADCYYDLLMSEARMTSYFAIATGQVPRRHWGVLGRTLAREDGYVGLVSWTGTMFEYFMPHLLLPVRSNSLGFESLRFCVYCQKKRSKDYRLRSTSGKSVPWGSSESGFYAFDPQLNYQYKAHGVQRLGLRRRLNDEFVVSPYSSFLCLLAVPDSAMKNLSRLEKMGMTGRFGFYEAVDLTKGRAGAAGYSVVRSYMAHHVGMSLLSVLNLLKDNSLQKRFMSAGNMMAAKELLEEKIPAGTAVFEDVVERDVPEKPGRTVSGEEEFKDMSPLEPRLHLLSGGEWTTAITDSGAGISSCQGDDMLLRSEDLLRRPAGLFAVAEVEGKRFSLTSAPDYSKDIVRRTTFSDTSADFFTETDCLDTGMRVHAHESLPCEVRRFALKNKTNRKLTVDLLIYMEPSLAKHRDAAAHPAFSRLFVRPKYDDEAKALLFTRRPREGESGSLSMAIGFSDTTPFFYDFDREKVLERPDGVSSLLREGIRLEGKSGRFLAPTEIPDPCAAIKIRMILPPKSQKTATLFLTAGRSEEEAVGRLLDCRTEGFRPAPSPLFDGTLDSRLSEVVLPELLFPCRDTPLRLLSARENLHGTENLWGMGISGDLPIILIEVKNINDLSRAEPYIRLHGKLRRYGIRSDLIVAFKQGGEYIQSFTEAARQLISAASDIALIDQKGGVYLLDIVRHESAMPTLRAAARHIAPDSVSVAPPAHSYTPVEFLPAERNSALYGADNMPIKASDPASDFKEVNGGYFYKEQFHITKKPLLPWCHVLANEDFGTLVSDISLGYTWALNCRENKLTPWYNDTRTDNRGEMLIMKLGGKYYDLINGSSPVFQPDFVRYEGQVEDISYTVTVTVKGRAKRVSVLMERQGSELSIEHGAVSASAQARAGHTQSHALSAAELSPVEIAYYTEPVLAVDRSTGRQITGKWENGKLLLHNPFQTAVPGYSLITAEGGADSFTCDRGGFLSGAWDRHTLCPLPDPCAAVIVKRELPAKRQEKINFVLTFGETAEKADTAIDFSEAFASTRNAVRIKTADAGLNQLVNNWLPVQIENSRIYGRCAFYQCGGAFGFRDQLQDVCASMEWNESYARRHILKCCAHQFEEGDVLHWWHPLPSGDAGVRTRFSDDLLWLPYTVAEYIERTGDRSILDEQVAYLSGAPLSGSERERFWKPEQGNVFGSVYEHCLRTLSRVKTGERGLPLMGTGDWNDGLSKVGEAGRGESVWMAQFASVVMKRTASVICKGRDEEAAAELVEFADRLLTAVDENAYSGQWYLRAFMDDGTPLGAPGNSEMEIDLLPEAFSVLAGMPDKERRRSAIDSAITHLVDKKAGIIKLFTPPFDHLDPGYIRGYPPGMRENGGQYTHAAIWLVSALFMEGRTDEGYELLQMVSPVTRSEGANGDIYKTEPYAITADVYSTEGLAGRGGWSLYTGSAGWYYRCIVGTLLGIQRRGNTVNIEPRLPSGMNGFEAELFMKETTIKLTIKTDSGHGPGLFVDGTLTDHIPLDSTSHEAVFYCAKPTAEKGNERGLLPPS